MFLMEIFLGVGSWDRFCFVVNVCLVRIILLCFVVICLNWFSVFLVFVGIRCLMIMFFFKLISWLDFLFMVVLVSMCVVFWNEVVEINDLVCKEVFVMLSRIGFVMLGWLFLVFMWVFILLNFRLLICLFFR